MIWSLITSNLEWLLGGLAAIGTALFMRSTGKTAERADHLEKQSEREEKGRDAVSKEKAKTAGANRRTIIDRLRGRDGDWSGM